MLQGSRRGNSSLPPSYWIHHTPCTKDSKVQRNLQEEATILLCYKLQKKSCDTTEKVRPFNPSTPKSDQLQFSLSVSGNLSFKKADKVRKKYHTTRSYEATKAVAKKALLFSGIQTHDLCVGVLYLQCVHVIYIIYTSSHQNY